MAMVAQQESEVSNTFTINYHYKDVPTIWKFSQDDSRIRLLMGPVGSGKSSGCIWEIIRKGLSYPVSKIDGIRRTRWAVIRNHYRQLSDTTIKTFFEWFPPSQFGEWRVAENVYKITAFANTEIEILFRALDSPEHVSNLLSLDITGAWINEAREISHEVFKMLNTRIGRYPSMAHGRGWKGIIMDTNPPDEDSWLYEMFEVQKHPHAKIFKQPSGLSPQAENLPNLDANYYQDLAIGNSPDFVKIYIHNEYGVLKSGKLVYSGYNDSLHVSKTTLKPVAGLPLILGVDFGATNSSVVICQVTPRGRFFVLEEFTMEDIGIRSFLNNILTPTLNSKYKGFTVVGYGDPSGVARAASDEQTCFNELRAAGYSISPANTNALAARLGAVEALLNKLIDGEPCFQIDPSCKILRKGFNGGYKFKEVKGYYNKYQLLPDKNRYSHVQDALQYASLYMDEKLEKSRKISFIIPQKYSVVSKAGY